MTQDKYLTQCEREIHNEYSDKISILNDRLKCSGTEYKLARLTSKGTNSLKVQVFHNGELKRILGLEHVDRKLRSTTLYSHEKENKCLQASDSSQREQEMNKVLFETIQLMNKLRFQTNAFLK